MAVAQATRPLPAGGAIRVAGCTRLPGDEGDLLRRVGEGGEVEIGEARGVGERERAPAAAELEHPAALGERGEARLLLVDQEGRRLRLGKCAPAPERRVRAVRIRGRRSLARRVLEIGAQVRDEERGVIAVVLLVRLLRHHRHGLLAPLDRVHLCGTQRLVRPASQGTCQLDAAGRG